MLDGLSVGVHFVDIDTGDPRIIRVVVEQVQKVHVRPYIVADGDDAVDDNAGASAFPGDLTKKLSQCDGAVGNERIVLNVRWTDELGRGFLRFLLVDHLFIKGKNIVFVANGAFIVVVYDLDHGWLLFCLSSGPGVRMPALLMRRSRPASPRVSDTSRAQLWTLFSSVMSQMLNATFPP